MNTVLITERHDDIIILILNRPQSFNAINSELRVELISALEQANLDDSVRAVIVTGAGEKAFCSGQDLTETSHYGIDDVEAWLTSLEGVSAWYQNEEWILNIADLVVTEQELVNDGTKLLQIRFYPVSTTEYVMPQ